MKDQAKQAMLKWLSETSRPLCFSSWWLAQLNRWHYGGNSPNIPTSNDLPHCDALVACSWSTNALQTLGGPTMWQVFLTFAQSSNVVQISLDDRSVGSRDFDKGGYSIHDKFKCQRIGWFESFESLLPGTNLRRCMETLLDMNPSPDLKPVSLVHGFFIGNSAPTDLGPSLK